MDTDRRSPCVQCGELAPRRAGLELPWLGCPPFQEAIGTDLILQDGNPEADRMRLEPVGRAA